MLTLDERRQLLAIARAAFEAAVHGRRPRADTRPAASATGPGAFVTILCDGELRGCLGRISTELPLPGLIEHLAQEVADSDPRFDPVRPEELLSIRMEISVLTEEREVGHVGEIEVGRHGLIAEQGSRRGLLLPQVATDHGWDLEAFVTHTCLKAGLAADAWRRGARLYVFEAQVFGEGEM
jgi:AmmeMemoRadiSam system protein A